MSPIASVLEDMCYFSENAFSESGRVCFEHHCRQIAAGIISSSTDIHVHVAELKAKDCPPVGVNGSALAVTAPVEPGQRAGILTSPAEIFSSFAQSPLSSVVVSWVCSKDTLSAVVPRQKRKLSQKLVQLELPLIPRCDVAHRI